MRAHRAAWVAVASIAVIAGCSPKMGNQSIRTETARPQMGVERIEPGVTTQDQVHVWFGQPDAVRVDNLGAAEWGYSHDLNGGRIRGTIERFEHWVVEPVDRFMNEVVFYPPSSAPLSEARSDQLSVSFGPDGVVTQFAYRVEP